jgi:hypothetical protein
MYTIQNTDAVKQMVSEGKVVGPGKGAFIRNVISNCVCFEAMLSFRYACDND